MASQHTANVPSVHARLGSIPRLSAKLVIKEGSGVRRIRLAAPACRAECSIGASRFESGDTHHKGPVVQPVEATGSKSVKSGLESQRGHRHASMVQSARANYRLLLRTCRIGRGRYQSPLDSKAVQVFAQAIGIVRGRFATA
jgi:hypothetical protein